MRVLYGRNGDTASGSWPNAVSKHNQLFRSMVMPNAVSTVEYRDIQGFPGYRVGSDGSVWSNKRTRPVKLRPFIDRDGYAHVSLFHHKYHCRLVHRLVLEAFVGRCPDGMECRHFPDNNPSNNRLSNISWASHTTNIRDRNFHGTDVRGTKSVGAIVNDIQVREIRSLFATGDWSYCQLAKRYGLTKSGVASILSGDSWAWLGGQQGLTGDAKRKIAKRVFDSRPKGESHGQAKLTAQQVIAIRSRPSETLSSLAKQFMVSIQTVWRIRKGESWKSLKETVQ